MKKIFLTASFCVACLLGTSTGCMTTSASVAVDNEYEAPPIDEVGLEDGRTSYSWMKYKGTIPFASDATKSTAVSGGKNGTPVFASVPRKSKAKSVAKNP